MSLRHKLPVIQRFTNENAAKNFRDGLIQDGYECEEIVKEVFMDGCCDGTVYCVEGVKKT